MKEYADILRTILETGTNKPNRTGEDTLSLFNYNYKIDLRNGFPLLTGKKINFDNILFEMLWFLSGNSSWDFLHKHGIHFWDEWEEGKGRLPKAYGEYWRKYPHYTDHIPPQYHKDAPIGWVCEDVFFDQFQVLINELKNNLNSRRLVLTNWFPPSAWEAKLPPCHVMSIFNTQYENGEPYLNLHLTQRSCDVPIGIPFNIASYALLLEIVGNIVNLPVRYFAHTLIDTHIYNNQKGAVDTYLSRDFRKLPTLKIIEKLTLEKLDDLIANGSTQDIKKIFVIEDYNPHPYIKMPVMV